jgi:RNA polymerase sigma-70 factor (ECF subfamily)
MTAISTREAGDIAEAVERSRRGDPAAAEAIALHACRSAMRTAAAIMRSRDQAADVAQDVAVDVLRSLHKLREPAALDAWVHRITVRHTLRALRGRRGDIPLALLPEESEPHTPEGPDADLVLDARRALAAAMAELPPRQRLALALRYVHDLSDDEIATALGCRTGTVHALLSRGRAGLRRDHLLLAMREGSA